MQTISMPKNSTKRVKLFLKLLYKYIFVFVEKFKLLQLFVFKL